MSLNSLLDFIILHPKNSRKIKIDLKRSEFPIIKLLFSLLTLIKITIPINLKIKQINNEYGFPNKLIITNL